MFYHRSAYVRRLGSDLRGKRAMAFSRLLGLYHPNSLLNYESYATEPSHGFAVDSLDIRV